MMKWNKIKSNKGETLIETLVSILIAALSVALLTTSVMAAARMNKTARDADAEFYKKLEAAELRMVDSSLSPAEKDELLRKNEGKQFTVYFGNHASKMVIVDIYGNDVFATYIEHEFE